MVPLEESIGFTINCDITKMTFIVSQPHIIAKITQKFNYVIKSLMTTNTTAVPHKGIVCKKETGTTNIKYMNKRYHSGRILLIYVVNRLCT